MRFTLKVLVTACTLLAFGMPAAASASTAPAHHRAAKVHNGYCAAEAPLAGSHAKVAVHCYRTFRQSIRHATGGRVNLPANVTPRTVTRAEINSGNTTPAAEFVLSIDYQNSGYGGSTFTWYQSAQCGYYQAASMPSGWNDEISSVHNYSNCATTLFWNSNFGQPTYNIGKNAGASSLGVFNDQTSSQKWCPSSPC